MDSKTSMNEWPWPRLSLIRFDKVYYYYLQFDAEVNDELKTGIEMNTLPPSYEYSYQLCETINI